MSATTRMGAALMAAVMVLAVGAPAVAAHEPVNLSVDEGDSTYTVTVTHNGSGVDNASVDVAATNATYSASGVTGPNGTVTFDLPENETEVNITATFDNHSATGTFVLSGANDTTWDGEGPFGLWVSSWLQELIDPGSNTVFGLAISDIITANNPGSEHRSDKANPGGNATGPPEHAVNKSADKGNNSSNGGASSSGGSDNGNKGGGDKGNSGKDKLARPAGL